MQRNYRYLDFVSAAFVAVLLCANLIGVSKVVMIGGTAFTAGNLFFPMSYLFGDILTEVYGYKRSRRVVWTGLIALLFASFMSWVVIVLPPAPFFKDQAAVETIFGSTPRIALASILAYVIGEFINSVVLAKMKIMTEGKHLWMRTIGSTIAGEAIDTLLFFPLAFYGVWDDAMLTGVMLTNYAIKVSWETLATPVTYKVVGWLKRAESEDYFDRGTKFTPFSLDV